MLTSHLFEDCPDVSFAQLELVYRIVPSVSFSTEKALKAAGQWLEWHQTCPELHAVQDADRLDAMGAVGILRCAAFSGVRGRYLVEEQPGAGPGCEGHFYTKLLTLKLMMKVCCLSAPVLTLDRRTQGCARQRSAIKRCVS